MRKKNIVIFSIIFLLGALYSSCSVQAASITVTTPGSLTTGSTYNIGWAASGTTGQYAIWLCRGSSTSSCDNSYRIASPVTGNSYSWTIPSSLATASDYKINIYDWAALEDYASGYSNNFTINGSTTLSAPVLVSPANGSVVNSLTPSFQWVASSGAGAYVWEIMYVDSNILTGNQTSVSYGKLSWAQTYTWRVRACTNTSMDSCGDWSNQWTFTTQASASQSPTLNISANYTQISSGSSSTLTWTSTNATSCIASASPANIQWDGIKALSSSQTIGNITTTTIFTLNCSGSGGSQSQSITVMVNGSTATKQIVVIYPNGGETFSMGNTYDIAWSSTGIDKVNISIDFGGTGGLGIVTNGVQASLGKYSWKVDATNNVNTANKIVITDASDSSIYDKSNNYFTVSSSGSSNTNSGCEASSFSSVATAFDFQQTAGSKTNLCGSSQQYFKATIPSGKTCDIKWTLTPDSSSDYDLYVKNDASLTRNTYDSRSTNGKGSVDEVIKTGLSAGTYYAMANKESSTTGNYSIAVSFLNCSGGVSTGTSCTTSSNCPSGQNCVNNLCTSPTSTNSSCDASSFSQAISAFDFQSGGSKTNLCGEGQYFKSVIPSGKTCDIKWTLTPDSSSDYDLYVKNDASLTRNAYGVRSVEGKGKVDEISQASLSSGTYYALVYKAGSTAGNYAITASQLNCSGSSTIVLPTTTNPSGTTNTDTQSQVTQLQNQINQLLTQIAQLQSDLTKIKGQQSTSQTEWCYTFTAKLKYKDTGYAVGALQAALQKEGILNASRLTTYFGQTTLDAVIKFQEKYKSEILSPANLVKGTGYVGSLTVKKLNQLYGCK